MRRGVGVGGLHAANKAKEHYKVVGEEVRHSTLEAMKGQMTLFRTKLEEFALKHREDIRRDPAFRAQFHAMCAHIGVDPLASNKGVWAKALGIGDYYFELGVQIVEACWATRDANGGLLDVPTLLRLVNKRRGSHADPATLDDVLRSIKKLKVLSTGSGFDVLQIGRQQFVRSVPGELNTDTNHLIELAQCPRCPSLITEMSSSSSVESSASPMDVESDDICWICLDDSCTDKHGLMSPCQCPRKVHPKCLARWQLQQAGKAEETQCRFCHSTLADWKASLTPEMLKPEVEKANPIMVVYFEGEIHRIPVKQGNAGLQEFTLRIRELFRLPEDVDISLTFGCKEPMSGQHLKLEGVGAFDAAVHCASVAAAERQQKIKSGGGGAPGGGGEEDPSTPHRAGEAQSDGSGGIGSGSSASGDSQGEDQEGGEGDHDHHHPPATSTFSAAHLAAAAAAPQAAPSPQVIQEPSSRRTAPSSYAIDQDPFSPTSYEEGLMMTSPFGLQAAFPPSLQTPSSPYHHPYVTSASAPGNYRHSSASSGADAIQEYSGGGYSGVFPPPPRGGCYPYPPPSPRHHPHDDLTSWPLPTILSGSTSIPDSSLPPAPTTTGSLGNQNDFLGGGGGSWRLESSVSSITPTAHVSSMAMMTPPSPTSSFFASPACLPPLMSPEAALLLGGGGQQQQQQQQPVFSALGPSPPSPTRATRRSRRSPSRVMEAPNPTFMAVTGSEMMMSTTPSPHSFHDREHPASLTSRLRYSLKTFSRKIARSLLGGSTGGGRASYGGGGSSSSAVLGGPSHPHLGATTQHQFAETAATSHPHHPCANNISEPGQHPTYLPSCQQQ